VAGWKRLLDSSSIGTAIPGRAHSHYFYNVGDAHYSDTEGGTCTGAEAVNEPDCIMQGGDWSPALATWLGGIYNAWGDINGMYTLPGAPQVSVQNDTTNAHPDFTSLGKLNHLVYMTGWGGSARWQYANAASDTSGAKKMLGLILDLDYADAKGPDGPNNMPGPYIPNNMTNGIDGSGIYQYRVLTQGYIAITLRQLFASTDDLSINTPMTYGDNVYMSLESGKLTITPPEETGQVVRIVGNIAGLKKSDGGEENPHDLAVIYFNPSPVWLEVS
tara:strand:- start:4044 stop:4865 length:822 start_codon:yes stop_codon:yes gene_type:complete